MKGHDLRISLTGADGEEIWGAWAKDMHNANSQAPVRVRVQIRCDLDKLHQIGDIGLPFWPGHD